MTVTVDEPQMRVTAFVAAAAAWTRERGLVGPVSHVGPARAGAHDRRRAAGRSVRRGRHVHEGPP